MKSDPKYIKFIQSGLSASGKTKIWRVISKEDEHDFLGWVKWYSAWRCYALYPISNIDGGLVFEKQCLHDIADFCEKETKNHMESKRNEK
jgi:hypothetical protein